MVTPIEEVADTFAEICAIKQNEDDIYNGRIKNFLVF